MKNNKWRISKINEGLEMTRISGQAIEIRKLNYFERVIYYRKIRRNKWQDQLKKG